MRHLLKNTLQSKWQVKMSSIRQDLNPHNLAQESCALPLRYNNRNYKLVNLLCSTGLQLACTRWVRSKFSSHCPLSSTQRSWSTWTTSFIFSSEKISGILIIEPGQLDPEARMLTIVRCCPHSPSPLPTKLVNLSKGFVSTRKRSRTSRRKKKSDVIGREIFFDG